MSGVEPGRLWQLPLAEFCDAVEARAMPGCGAVAGVSAATGLALVLKGLRISDRHDPYAERQARIAEADRLLATLRREAEEDMAAFQGFLAARKTDDDADLEQAKQRINRVPLAIGQACVDGLALTVDARALVDKTLQADQQAGALLLRAALSAVLLNVDANAAGVEDAAERERMRDERRRLQRAGDEYRGQFEA